MEKRHKPKQPRYTKRRATHVQRLLRLPPDLDAALVTLAASRGHSVTQTLIAMLRKALFDCNAPPP